MAKLIYGVGLNDVAGSYRSKIYVRWHSMIARCYSKRRLEKYPSYNGCTVCDEWLLFGNFKTWMENQDWHEKEIDKDLLIKGNKLYSPETCVLISREINSFIKDCESTRGSLLIGVNWKSEKDKFVAQCRNPINGKKEHLGYFSNEIDAHLAWKKRKLEHAIAITKNQTEAIARAVTGRYL